jgi:type IV secretion system protein VirD4
MIGALATRFSRNDYFVGRLSVAGNLGTLWPSGIKPNGLGITYGMQGSGKSTGVAIPNILLHPGPNITFDGKGELAQACYARRGAGGNGVRGLGQKTCVIDPLQITGLPRSRYNPLFEIAQETDTDNALRLMLKLAEGLVKTPDGGGGDNSWVFSGAVGVAYGMTAYLLAAYPAKDQNLVKLRQLLQEGEVKHTEAVAAGEKGKRPLTPFDELLVRMKVDAKGPFAHVSAGQAANIAKMGDRQLGTIFGALVESTTWLDLPKFRDTVTGCDFLLRDFMTERISVFVCLPLNELVGVAGGFMRFFLTMFLQTMYQKNPHRLPLPHGPVLCLVDEFPQFGNLPGFCKVGPTMRDYHVKLMILLQDMGQLRKVYGEEDASNFHGCAAFVQIMAMKHLETLDWLVKAVGERQVRERQPDGRTMMRVYPLLDRGQAALYLAARAGNQIVLRGDDRPMRLKTAPYFWFLPFWLYTPDPRHPEPFLRRWMRRRAVRLAETKTAETKAGKQGTVGKGVRHDARGSAGLYRRAAR